MLNALAKDLITTFIATSMTFAAVQIALPSPADSTPVRCETICSGTIPPVRYEVKQRYQSVLELQEERQAELEEMAILEAEAYSGMSRGDEQEYNHITPRLKK